MARLTDADIEAIARRIVADLNPGASAAPAAAAVTAADHNLGIFPTVDEAVKAAREAQPVYVALPLRKRAEIIAAIRAVMLENAAVLAKAAHEETKLGRFEDKITKNLLVTEKTPGLEHLEPQAITGDHGLTLIEPAPFGVIGAITPCTNPTSTIICNTIGMIAAGKHGRLQCSSHRQKLLDADGGPHQQNHPGPRRPQECHHLRLESNHRERGPDDEAPEHPPRGGDGRRRSGQGRDDLGQTRHLRGPRQSARRGG
jgi:hypothetical protein